MSATATATLTALQQLPNDERQLLARIPNNTNVNAVSKRCFEDYDFSRTAKAKKALPSETERMAKFKEVWEQTMTEHLTGSYKSTLKVANKAVKALTGRETKSVSANTPAVRACVWLILNQLCRKHFEQMARGNKELLKKYMTGEKSHIDITVSTAWLADKTNLNKGSFRGTGEGCIYNSFERLGFADRSNFKRNGEQAQSGHEVLLRVNVSKWFWGHSHAMDITPVLSVAHIAPSDSAIFLAVERGNSMQIDTISVKKQTTKEVALASPRMSQAPCGATTQVDGEVEFKVPVNATTTQEVSCTGPAESAPPQITQIAEECLKLMLQTVFCEKNLKSYKVVTNKENAITFISPASQDVCRQKIEAIIIRLRSEGMSIPQIADEIIKHTTKTAKSLENGTRAYVYAPEMWLRMDFNSGTLFSSIQQNDPSTVKIKQKPTVTSLTNLDTEGVYVQTQIAWVLAQGFGKSALGFYIAKHGIENIAMEAERVRLCIEMGRYKVKSTVERYLNGAFKNLKVEFVKENLNLLKAKLNVTTVVKPGHVLAKWLKFITENTQNSQIIQAWSNLRPHDMNEECLVIEPVTGKIHREVLLSDASLRLWAAARKATGFDLELQEMPRPKTVVSH